MSLTRFYDRVSGRDGPVSGALQVITVGFDDVAANETVHRRINFPAGMGFYVTGITVWSGTVTSDPSLTVGTTAGGAQIVAAVNVVTNLGAATLVSNQVAAGGFIDVRVVADAGDAAENISVTIIGYPSSPPTALNYR